MREEVIRTITLNPQDVRKAMATLSEADRATVIQAAIDAAEIINAILADYIEAEGAHDRQ